MTRPANRLAFLIGAAGVLLAIIGAAASCGTSTTSAPPPASLSPATATQPASPSPSATATQPPALRQVHDPGQVTGTILGPCHTRDGGQLPDLSCTPGAYDPRITAAVLCAAGYTTSAYRPPASQTTAFKHQQAYPAYGIPAGTTMPSELDHDVPLTLGGANDASNLWPQMGPIPNPKDTIEVQLHHWVCAAADDAEEARLHEAQQAIAADWMTAEQTLGVK